MNTVYSSGAYPAPNAIWEIGLQMPSAQLYTGARLEMNAGSLVRWYYSPQFGALEHTAFNNQLSMLYLTTQTVLNDLPENSQFTVEWTGDITINGTTLSAPTRGSLNTALKTGANHFWYDSYEGLVLNTPAADISFNGSLTLSGNIQSFTYYSNGVPFYQKNKGDQNIYGGYSIEDYNALTWVQLTNWLPSNEPDMEFNYAVGAKYYLIQITNLIPYTATPNVPAGKILPTITTTRQTQSPLDTPTENELNATTLPLSHKQTIKTTVPSVVSPSAMPYYNPSAGYVAPNAVAYGLTEIQITQPIATIHGANVDINGDAEPLSKFDNEGQIAYGSQINSISLQSLQTKRQTYPLPSMTMEIPPQQFWGLDGSLQYSLPKPARSVEVTFSGAWKNVHYLSTDPTTDEGLGFFPMHPDLEFTWDSEKTSWNSNSAVWGLLQPVAYSTPGYQGQLISRLQNPTKQNMTFALGGLQTSFSYNFMITYQSGSDCTLTANGQNYKLGQENSWTEYETPIVESVNYTVSITIPAGGWIDIQSMAIVEGLYQVQINTETSELDPIIRVVSENNRFNFGTPTQNFYLLVSSNSDNPLLPPNPGMVLQFHQ